MINKHKILQNRKRIFKKVEIRERNNLSKKRKTEKEKINQKIVKNKFDHF